MTEEGYIAEDRDWVYFGYGEGWERDRCTKCHALLRENLRPNEYCINCWKLEIFFSNCKDVEAVKTYLIEEAKNDPTLHGKWLKEEMEVPRKMLTSIPPTGHPDPDVKRDGVILIYTQNIKERDSRKKKILEELRKRGLYRKDDLSYRRGCLDFDSIIGNWTEWYDLYSDYPEGGELQ